MTACQQPMCSYPSCGCGIQIPPAQPAAVASVGPHDGPFSYEFIKGRTGDGGHYRIRDSKDNALCFCYAELNARDIADALNRSAPSHALASEREKELLRLVCPGNGDDPEPVRCQSYEASEQGSPCPPGCCVMADEKDVRTILAAIEREEGSAPSATREKEEG